MDLLLTFFLTLLSVLLGFVCYQYVVYGLMQWRDIRREIVIALTQQASFITYAKLSDDLADDLQLEFVEELRALAGEVLALQKSGPYRLWALLHWVPDSSRAEEIRGDLVAWSNSIIRTDDRYRMDREYYMEGLKRKLGLMNDFRVMDDLLKIQRDRDAKDQESLFNS